jgi:6-phosphogluconate dehydrogenase
MQPVGVLETAKANMRLGMVLEKMGANMARRLLCGGHAVVVTDLSPKAVSGMAKEGAVGSSSLEDFCAKLGSPRIAWLMVPAGEPTESTALALGERLQAGDISDRRRQLVFQRRCPPVQAVSRRGIHYVDVGTSGGVGGIERGYCMMSGGPKEVVQQLDPIFRTLAPGRGNIVRTPGREKMGGTAEEAISTAVPRARATL